MVGGELAPETLSYIPGIMSLSTDSSGSVLLGWRQLPFQLLQRQTRLPPEQTLPLAPLTVERGIKFSSAANPLPHLAPQPLWPKLFPRVLGERPKLQITLQPTDNPILTSQTQQYCRLCKAPGKMKMLDRMSKHTHHNTVAKLEKKHNDCNNRSPLLRAKLFPNLLSLGA